MGKLSNKKVGEARLISLFATMTDDLLSISSADEVKAFAVKRLLTRMRKRAEFDKPELHIKAEDDFVRLNESLKDVKVQLHPLIASHARDFILFALRKAIKRYGSEQPRSCYSESLLYERWNFGPGASNGCTGTGTAQKISQKMSCTDRAEPWVKQLRQNNSYFQCFDALQGNDGVVLVPGSRLTTVLKNEETVRTIAIEASGNMAFQLAGGSIIEDALRCVGLDIRNQQIKNNALARIGSKDQSVCTIDEKSASDMQVLDLARTLWPAEWCEFFERFRSYSTVLPSGRTIELNMLSTMGNGFTFPFMTMTILSLVYANRMAFYNGPFRYIDYTHTGVFGDDIIVPTREYATLCAQLVRAGYVVNYDKSYHEGPFRESCGGDFYKGEDVTPFYIRRLRQPADIYVALNQVLRWCGKHMLHMPRTLKFLLSLLDDKVFLVPEWMQDTSGVRTALCPRNFKYLRTEVIEIPYDGFFSLPLACGGYLKSRRRDGALSAQLRSDWVRYKVGISKLPKGYLDGWDPRYGTQSQSSHISFLMSMAR